MKIRKAYKQNDSLQVLYFKFKTLKVKFNRWTKEFNSKDFSLHGNKREKADLQILLNENFLMQYKLKKRIEEKINSPASLLLIK